MPYDICDDEVCLEYIESEMAAKGVTQQTIDMKRSETEMKMLDDLKQIYLQQLILINNSNKPATNNKTNNSRQTFVSKNDHDLHRIKGNFSFVDFLTFNLSKFYVVRENFLRVSFIRL